MFYFEAPDEVSADIPTTPKLFLAGGITSCPDWQREMRDLLNNTHLTLLNPRRANFPIDDPSAAEYQIAWEHRNLAKADAVLFWFPCETMCPIVLFELGAWAHWRTWDSTEHRYKEKKLFVGVHPEYQRRQDVEIQLKLQRPDIEIVYSLPDLAAQVSDWDKESRKKK